MILEVRREESDLRGGIRRELDRPALQPGEGELVLQSLRRQGRQPYRHRLAGYAVIGPEELPAVRAEGGCAGCAAYREPGMTTARHCLILARQDHPSEHRMREGEQVDVVGNVRLVVAHGAFVGEAQ